MRKLLSLLTALLFVGTMWAAEYQLVKSVGDLEAGAHYVIGATNSTTNTYFISTESNNNNRKSVVASVSNEKVTATAGMMTFTLGGSTGAWTFATDNYLGTAGYLNATNTTSSNYLKVAATNDSYGVFSISITDAGIATITCTGKSSHHIMYLYQSAQISCYDNKDEDANYSKPSIYKEIPAAVKAPTFSPNGGDFGSAIDVTLSQADSKDIYYTTNASAGTGTPSTESPWTKYTAAINLTATTTIYAAAKDGDAWSDVVSKTFTKLEPKTCAQFAQLANNAKALLNEVTVTYAKADGKQIWIQDATGALLLYYSSGNYGLATGDRVTDLIGTKTTYNTCVIEIIPTVQASALQITSGSAPTPTDFTTKPTSSDVSKYVKLKKVLFAENKTFTNEGNVESTTPTINGSSFTLRNNFKIAASFEAGKIYDVVGIVHYTGSDIQIYYIDSEELSDPSLSATPSAIDFETVEKDVAVAAKTFSLVGYNLTDANEITVSAPNGYKVSIGESTPASSLTINPASHSVSSTIKVTPVTSSNGEFNGNITISTADLGDNKINIGLTMTVTERFTVSFSTGTGNPTISPIQEATVLAGVELPASVTPAKEGWTFAGWAEAVVASKTTTAPTLNAGGSTYHPTEDVTLYAVYSQTVGAVPPYGTVTVTYNSTNFPTGYGEANTFTEYTLEGYKFKIQQIYKNGEKMQWRAEGNENGTGTIYNTEAFPNTITSIVLTYDNDANKNHTLYVGDSENPTSGTEITGTMNDAVETFDCSAEDANYFVLANGEYAGYTTSIAINYGDAGTTYYVSSPSDVPTALDNTELDSRAVKVMRNGILYIEKDGKQYNVMGQLIK